MKIINFICCILSIFLIQYPISLTAQEDVPPPPPMEAPPAPPPQAPAPAPGAPAPSAPAAAAAPAGPTTPDIQPEQLKWPDTIELSEGHKGLTQSSNKAILTLFNNSKKIAQEANEQLNKMNKSYEDFSKKFEEINTKIDTFLQDTAFIKGKVETQTSPSLKK